MKTMSRHFAVITLLFSFLIIVTDGCVSPKGEDKVKIGVILPLSGNLSNAGIPKKNAFDIAAEDINVNLKGKKIEFLYEDSKGTPRDGVSAFQKQLMDKSIGYFYVDLTPVVNACIPIINKSKVITFAGSAQAEVTEQSEYLYRIFAGGEQEIELIVNYLVSINSPKIYILHTNELYGTTAKDHLQRMYPNHGGNIIGTDEYSLSQKDFKDIINKVKKANFDKLVVLGYGLEFPIILKQLKEVSFPNEKIVMNLGATNSQVVALGAEFTDGITFVGPRFTYLLSNNLLNEKMKVFVTKYQEKYKVVPDFRAAYAYDFVSILYEAIRSSNTNHVDSVGKRILEMKDYDGVSGKISFKKNRDSQTDLVLAKYENGKMVLLDENK